MNPRARQQVKRVEDHDDHAIIHPSTALRQRALVTDSGKSDMDDVAIARAERALQALSVEFDHWMSSEVKQLIEAREALIEHGPQLERVAVMFRAAHDLRGQAPTLGFPLVARVAESLSLLLQNVPYELIPAALIDQHVNAIKAMIREDAKGLNNLVGVALAERLRGAVDQLSALNQSRGPR